MLNAYSNGIAGLERSKKHLLYSLILGVNFLNPAAGYIFSTSYLIANIWSLHKNQKVFRNPKRGFFGKIIRVKIFAKVQHLEGFAT